MKSSYIIALALMITLHAISQDAKKLVGAWEGKITPQLRMVVHIKADSNGNIISVLDSPDQAVFGIETEKTTVNGTQFGFEVPKLNASYSGRVINDSTIDGTLTQGVAIPLVLNRKKEEVASAKQPSIDNSIYKSVDVSVKLSHVTLSGTFFEPRNKKEFPVVLIISGSGPTDRDGNSPLLPGKNNSLLQLADSLARHGIGTLRYDKRGIGKSVPDTMMREETMTIDLIADDARAMYEWLRTRGYNNIFIAGHSEGSLIGLMIAEKLRTKGFISIAGAGRKAGEILKEQTSGQLSSGLKTEFDNDIDSLERGLSVSNVNTSLMSLTRPSIQPYMKSWLKLDPQQLISQLSCPVLIVQGTKDLQIKETDAQKLHKANPKSKLALIKDMNHVLKVVESDKTDDNAKAYSDPNLPVSKELVSVITNFIQAIR